MSKATTPAYPITIDETNRIVNGLFQSRKYRHSAYVFLAVKFGFRYSDTSRLTWADILKAKKNRLEIVEKKTGKRAVRTITPSIGNLTESIYRLLNEPDMKQPILISARTGKIPSINSMNMTANGKGKPEKYRHSCWLSLYDLDISPDNFSQHSFRKTSAIEVYEKEGIVAARNWLNHSRVDMTEKYLLLKESETANYTNAINIEISI